MDKTLKLMLGLLTAFALCKYSQAEWNATKDTANKTVSCRSHDNSSNCTDAKDDHRWSGHFSKCPQEYTHYCIHGTCHFVQEQNSPACRCEKGYIGSRCEYLDLDLLVGGQKQIVIAGVIAGLVFLLLVIVFICICTHRLKLCRKRRRKKEKMDEVETLHALHTLNTNEASSAPADTSDTNECCEAGLQGFPPAGQDDSLTDK
ncbi:probetacellulin isoform X2 [Pygocentrus nattereri]|uniref:probetacellulin isoform X2 n=1 Tax=Pygocentrus nattereri TaxID=42514 RepID=UPI000814739F|nr:probetacellulin isoform X2 [Pygocentrus nattereri]